MNNSSNIVWQDHAVNQSVRAALKGQKAMCIWFTGLSGAGKSTLANLLEQRLVELGKHTYLLDGDNVRHGLNRDLGFSNQDRSENIRRVAEVSKLMVDAGLIVIVAFISPFMAERSFARSLFEAGQFIEVYIDTPIDICEERDTKGLYERARRGDLRGLTGIDSPYEAPISPEIRVSTGQLDSIQSLEMLMSFFDDRNG